MTANNVFRFVTVRPPVLASAEPAHFIVNEEAAQSSLNLLKQRAVGRTMPEARIILAKDFHSAATYYRVSQDWAPLRPKVSEVAAALPRMTDRASVELKAIELLAPVMSGGDFIPFLSSDRYVRLYSQLWRSYHATILDPKLAPQDREEMVIWIKFFALLGRFTGELAPFLQLLLNVTRIRVAVPLEFVHDAPVTNMISTPVTPPPHAAHVTELKTRRDQLAVARNFLAQLYANKVTAFRSTLGGATQKVKVPGSKGTHSHGSPDNRSSAPWRMLESDFDGKPAVLTDLRSMRIEPLNFTLPRLIHEVELKLALYQAELARWGRKQVVTFAGRALVSVVRPIS